MICQPACKCFLTQAIPHTNKINAVKRKQLCWESEMFWQHTCMLCSRASRQQWQLHCHKSRQTLATELCIFKNWANSWDKKYRNSVKCTKNTLFSPWCKKSTFLYILIVTFIDPHKCGTNIEHSVDLCIESILLQEFTFCKNSHAYCWNNVHGNRFFHTVKSNERKQVKRLNVKPWIENMGWWPQLKNENSIAATNPCLRLMVSHLIFWLVFYT